MPTRFKGQVRVASRIVDYLSSGLYKSPAACLKELINNSYDADAREVSVFVKPDANRIIIEDNGEGMSREEFTAHFSRVTESHKRDASDKTPSRRPKIGRIGIGFIAANELCEVIEIFSTKRGSTDLLHVTLDFSTMRLPPEQRRKHKTEFAKSDYVGEVKRTTKNSHYTHLFLKNVRGEARQILAGARKPHAPGKAISLYGLKPASMCERLADPELTSWDEFDLYSRTMLQVGLNVPVRYHDGWMPSRLRSKVRGFERETSDLNFRVKYDGAELRKPTVINPAGRAALVMPFTFRGRSVSARGYFYAQHTAIRPKNLRGLLVRIRHSAVGEYDPSFLGFPETEGPLFQSWISGEVWADDRLEDALNIDRRTLRDTHPAFVELQEAMHKELSKVLKAARERLYQRGSVERRKLQAKKAVSSIEEFVENSVDVIGQSAGNRLIDTWKQAARRKDSRNRLLKKYSVAELYSIVVEVAEEVLDPAEVRRFLKALTNRLSR